MAKNLKNVKPTVAVAANVDAGEDHPLLIHKPTTASERLAKFKTKNPVQTIDGVGTLITALPVLGIGQAGDFVRLHESEAEYWSDELSFVTVPIDGDKHGKLHLIEDSLAVAYLPAKKIKRYRLALATKPMKGSFFLCQIPTRNLESTWNSSNIQACETARTLWVEAVSMKPTQEFYKINPAKNQNAFRQPVWPTRTLDEIIDATFRGAMIETEDDPGLRRLIGDVQDLSVTRSQTKGCFRNIVVLDFEYEVAPGGLPNVLCMVAQVLDGNLRHVRTVRRWRGEFDATPPFDIGDDTLIAGYSLWAEMTCFLQLGWRFPVHLFDQHTAYIASTNVLAPHDPEEVRQKPPRGLDDACTAYGIVDGWVGINKGQISKDIGEGRWRLHGQAAVFDYCEKDVCNTVELLRRQIRGHGRFAPADPDRVLHWSNYAAKDVAQIQARGMPIDIDLWWLVQEHKATVVGALIQRFDPSYGSEFPIYSPDGEWSTKAFEWWLISVGVTEWPRLETGALALKSDAFRIMYGAHPAIEGIHALRDALGVIIRARIPIGPDGRNRPSLFPFGTATSRNAQAKSLYNAHSSMRSFMKFAPDKIGVYLDWRTQEVGVAAARSGDPNLIKDYLTGDIYHALAKLCGWTNLDIPTWKRDCKDQRQRAKALQLGLNYGMGVRSLARGIDRHLLISSEIILRHRDRYNVYYPWRDGVVERAMLERVIHSEIDGWPLHLSTSPNRRTLYNYLMQSGGAEMLRLATSRLCAADLVPIMLVHDGILFELDNEEQVQHAIEIMRGAGRDTCNGLEIGVDIDQRLVGGARYRDKRPLAVKMWKVVMGVLQEIGALPKTEAV